jgi:hypothetical protein
VETSLKNQIDTKASEMDLQDLKVGDCIFYFYRIKINDKSYLLQVDVSSKASVTELDSVETNLQNQMDSKSSEMDLQTLKVRGIFLYLENSKLMVIPTFAD